MSYRKSCSEFGCAGGLCGEVGRDLGGLCGGVVREGLSQVNPVGTHSFVKQNCTFCWIFITSFAYMDAENLGLEWPRLLSRHHPSFKVNFLLEFTVLRETYLWKCIPKLQFWSNLCFSGTCCIVMCSTWSSSSWKLWFFFSDLGQQGAAGLRIIRNALDLSFSWFWKCRGGCMLPPES